MISPKKSLGQNFLINSGVMEKIKESLGLSNKDVLLEIGAGPGNLTSFLSRSVKKLYAVEIDKRFNRELFTLKEQFNNIEIIWGDFLKIELNEDIKIADKACGNLPYNIGTPILERIAYDTDIPLCVFMFAKGSADRFLAKEGCKEYSSGTIFANTFFKVEKIAIVSKNSFYPAPKVDSEILKFIRIECNNKKEIKDFNNFTKKLFSFRRKTLLNSLSRVLGSKDETLRILNSLSINQSLRAEMLDINTLKKIFVLSNMGNESKL